MRKLKKDDNALDLIPVRNPALSYTQKDGLVTLTVPNIGFFNKIAQTFFHRPAQSYIHLDAYASYVWLGINGKRDIRELGQYLKRRYKDAAEPLYERLVKFIWILKDNHYIGLTDAHGERVR